MEKKKERHLFRKVVKIFGWFLGVLILLLVALILFIRSPWGQDVVIQRAAKYVSKKTNFTVEIEKLFITFDGNIMLNGLYLEDNKGDTLVYSKSLEANVPLLPLLRGNGVAVDFLKWDGLKVRILRKDSISGYNFQHLIDAFASEEKTPETQEDAEAVALMGTRQIFYARLPEVKGTAGTASFVVDEVLPATAAYMWTMNHTVPVKDPAELYQLSYETVESAKVGV